MDPLLVLLDGETLEGKLLLCFMEYTSHEQLLATGIAKAALRKTFGSLSHLKVIVVFSDFLGFFKFSNSFIWFLRVP